MVERYTTKIISRICPQKIVIFVYLFILYLLWQFWLTNLYLIKTGESISFSLIYLFYIFFENFGLPTYT